MTLKHYKYSAMSDSKPKMLINLLCRNSMWIAKELTGHLPS